jgi:hypothetical protein
MRKGLHPLLSEQKRAVQFQVMEFLAPNQVCMDTTIADIPKQNTHISLWLK